MNASRKLAAYAAALAVVLGASVVAGGAIDPTGLANAEPTEEHGGMPEGMTLPGLAAADDGLRLVADTDTQQLGIESPYRFRIVDEDGTVTDFDVEHTKPMHLIVVRRDFVGFQHLHPEMRDDGTWEIPVGLVDAGTYRVFAGDQFPQRLPDEDRLAEAGDGYTVELEGAPVTGAESELEFVVRHDGAIVADLPEYLGARGHLVALRDGDLAYLHVHADEERLSFEADFPTAGAYRLFLQFQHGGEVRTAAFTVDAEEI
jgi:hypothetical protein